MKTTDECAAEAERWLAEAERERRRGIPAGSGHADVISACAEVAEVWVRLGELARLRTRRPAPDASGDDNGAARGREQW